MELKEVESFYEDILGRNEYILRDSDLILANTGIGGINYFPISFYNLLLNKSGFFVLVPMLRQAGYSDQDISDIKGVINDYNKNLNKG